MRAPAWAAALLLTAAWVRAQEPPPPAPPGQAPAPAAGQGAPQANNAPLAAAQPAVLPGILPVRLRPLPAPLFPPAKAGASLERRLDLLRRNSILALWDMDKAGEYIEELEFNKSELFKAKSLDEESLAQVHADLRYGQALLRTRASNLDEFIEDHERLTGGKEEFPFRAVQVEEDVNGKESLRVYGADGSVHRVDPKNLNDDRKPLELKPAEP